MAANLVTVDFHGDELLAVQDERGVWVPLKRPCEALGIQPHGQAEKLKAKAWAVTQMVCATGADGKSYEMFCIHVDSLPMWLATIDASRVSEDVREKLERYQVECAAVLRDHFARKVTRAGLAAISFGEELVFAARTLVPELHSPEPSWVARVRDLLTPEEV